MAEKSAFSRPISAAFGKATGVFSRPKLQRRAYTARTGGELTARLPHVAIDFNEEKQRADNHTNGKASSCEEIELSQCLTTQVDLESKNSNNSSNNNNKINDSSNSSSDCSRAGTDGSNKSNHNCKENHSCIGNNNVVNVNINSTSKNNNNNNNNNNNSNHTAIQINDSNSKSMMAHSNTLKTNNGVSFPQKEITRQNNDELHASKPKGQPKTNNFTSDHVQDIIRETLKTQLIHMEYRHRECGEKGRIISQLIKKSVEALISDMYKVMVLIHIGAVRDKGIDMACKCSWSPGIDFFVMETYKTQSIFASATVFATIYE